MFGYDLSFDRPAYLALLLLAPLTWLIAGRGLAAMGRGRWLAAISLRTALVAMFALALAEIHVVHTSDRLAVVYLVDRSLSIPADRLAGIVEFVNASIRTQRQTSRGDVAGVITFGGNASVEIPPWAGDVALAETFETAVQPDQTDLESALRLARAILPPNCAKRVVVLSDGNQTLGDALVEARALTAEGVGIDVVPIDRPGKGDVAIDKLVAPAEAHQGTPFDLRVVLTHSAAGSDAPVPGRLVVRRSAGGDSQTVAEQPIEVRPGTQVFTLREELAAAGFFTYEARFVPDDPAVDAVSQNNAATAFAHVRGHGRVLLIVEGSRAAEFEDLVEVLRKEKFDVTVQFTNQLFTSLAELQSYDVIVLADVPKTGGDDAASLVSFSDDQVKMLAENTGRLGCGLVLLGGPNSFGAGGWTNTPVEEAMPVDFQIKNEVIVPSGALMLVVDKSGSMSGEKIAMCRSAAIEAVKTLGDRDYVGVVAFDSVALKVVPLAKVANREAIVRRISRLDASGGTNMQPAMIEGIRALRGAEAAIKHMIVLTDGQTQPGNYLTLAADMRREGMTVSAVALGPDADKKLLADIAVQGGGKFYHVTSPRVVPRIFMREARRVARPLVYEDERGFLPQVTFPHEIMRGVEAGLPPLTGYVLTTPKTNPLVEISLASPVPSGQINPLLATWQYGLGRSAVWTTDVGQRWAKAWPAWEGREKLLTQLVRWAMRPRGGEGNFLVTTEVQDKRVRLVLTALDRDDRFVNFLAPQVSVLGPQMQHVEASLSQEAPGRYVGQFEAPAPGAYFVVVAPIAGGDLLRIGVNIGYSDEFRRRDENAALLAQLAALVPEGGDKAGQVIELPKGLLDDPKAALAGVDVFRHDLAKAASRNAAWHLLLFAASCLFLGDVFNRRVAWTALPVGAAAGRLRSLLFRGRAEAPAAPAMERLRQRKAELHEHWQGAYLATPPADAPDVSEILADGAASAVPSAKAVITESRVSESAAEQETYMTRLLKAKQTAAPRRSD